MTTLVMDNSNNKSSDEAQLLALVGGTVEDMNQYEEQVIQQAERSTAPLLAATAVTTTADDVPVTLGFRHFVHSLAPSYSQRTGRATNSTDIAHFQTVLTRTRKELYQELNNDESRRAQILRFKEQMILVYLMQQKLGQRGDDVQPISIVREIAAEQDRKLRIQNQQTTVQQSWTSTKLDTSIPPNEASLEHQQETEPTRKRRRLQSYKSQQQEAATAVHENEEERCQILKQKRKERQERRRQRLAQLLGDHEADEEIEFVDELSLKIPAETTSEQETRQSAGADEEEVPECVERALSPTPLKIDCPLCFQAIALSPHEIPDQTLSQHMDQCQQSGRRLRRRPPKTYAESDVVDDEHDVEDQKAVPRTRSSRRIASISETTPKRIPSPKPMLTQALDDLEEWVYEDRVDAWIENGLINMKQMAERDDKEVLPGAVVYGNSLHIPAWVNNRLFSYQRQGLQWMWDLHQQESGGIVGDEMGLGKTVQVCAFLGCMAASRKLKSALIVCPATMLRHWLQELATWAPGLRRILIHKSGETDGSARCISASMLKTMNQWLKKSRADRLYEPIDEQDFIDNDDDSFVGTGYVFVTSYESLRRSPDIWTSHRWTYVVLDEGQKIRNPDSDITLVCKRLRTPHRLLLSGTPIQNDLKELWTLFDFVFPGRLGTLPTFETEFAEPIKRGGFSNASPMQVQLAYRCALVLKDLINPYLLRRQKKDVEEVSRMPSKTEQVLFCRLSKIQRRLYAAYLQSDEVMSVLRGSAQLFRSITILRKISNHPDLVCDPTDASYEAFAKSDGHHDSMDSDNSDDGNGLDDFESLVERSGKLEVLAKILPLWQKQGHRVLIFCQWTKMLDILQRFVIAQGWKFGRMDGQTSVSSRQSLIDAFNADESYFVLLMTTRTGGVGVNLTGANRVVIYDPDWNPQTDSQARARSHRFGQTKPVTIYRLITAGTIEEKIYHRQIFKTALTNRVLQDPKQKRLFSQRDLRDFFTLKADDGSIIRGGHGVTELGTMTNGRGVIDPETLARKNKVDNDDDDGDKETLESIMKSKGLAGVFDHDFVDTSDVKKSLAVREMEEKARQVAVEAVNALKASADTRRDRFEPTFTGSEETASGRFGHGGILSRAPGSSFGQQGSDDNVLAAGISRRNTSATPSSKSLLDGLRSTMMQSPNGAVIADAETSRYAALLKRIQSYIQRHGGYRAGGGPTTDEVLKEFIDVAPSDASIFRRLLNSIAKVERGRWSLKELEC